MYLLNEKVKVIFILATNLFWKVWYTYISSEKIMVLRANETSSRKSNQNIVEQGFKRKPPIISPNIPMF